MNNITLHITMQKNYMGKLYLLTAFDWIALNKKL